MRRMRILSVLDMLLGEMRFMGKFAIIQMLFRSIMWSAVLFDLKNEPVLLSELPWDGVRVCTLSVGIGGCAIIVVASLLQRYEIDYCRICSAIILACCCIWCLGNQGVLLSFENSMDWQNYVLLVCFGFLIVSVIKKIVSCLYRNSLESYVSAILREEGCTDIDKYSFDYHCGFLRIVKHDIGKHVDLCSSIRVRRGGLMSRGDLHYIINVFESI